LWESVQSGKSVVSAVRSEGELFPLEVTGGWDIERGEGKRRENDKEGMRKRRMVQGEKLQAPRPGIN